MWRQRCGANRHCLPSAAYATTCLPAFVEFDMSVEGFGCLFLPSLAPQRIAVTATSLGGEGLAAGSSSTCVGGVGIGQFF